MQVDLRLLETLLTTLEASTEKNAAANVARLLDPAIQTPESPASFDRRKSKVALTLANELIVCWVHRFQKEKEFKSVAAYTNWIEHQLSAIIHASAKCDPRIEPMWSDVWEFFFPNPRILQMRLPKLRRRISLNSVQEIYTDLLSRFARIYQPLLARASTIRGSTFSLKLLGIPSGGVFSVTRNHPLKNDLNLAARELTSDALVDVLRATPRPHFVYVKEIRRSFLVDAVGFIHPLRPSSLLKTRHEGWAFLEFLLRHVATRTYPHSTRITFDDRQSYRHEFPVGVRCVKPIFEHHFINNIGIEPRSRAKRDNLTYDLDFPYSVILVERRR